MAAAEAEGHKHSASGGKSSKRSKKDAGESNKEEEEGAATVLYVGRLPHGFYEQQLRAYFSQFGSVKKVRVSRSKRTARAKHFAFIEFASSAVCAIAARTMDGYVLMERALRCRPVPPSKLHPSTLKGANRTFCVIPWTRIARERHNSPRSENGCARLASRIQKKQSKKQEQITRAGIDYSFVPLEPMSQNTAAQAEDLALGERVKPRKSSAANSTK